MSQSKNGESLRWVSWSLRICYTREFDRSDSNYITSQFNHWGRALMQINWLLRLTPCTFNHYWNLLSASRSISFWFVGLWTSSVAIRPPIFSCWSHKKQETRNEDPQHGSLFAFWRVQKNWQAQGCFARPNLRRLATVVRYFAFSFSQSFLDFTAKEPHESCHYLFGMCYGAVLSLEYASLQWGECLDQSSHVSKDVERVVPAVGFSAHICSLSPVLSASFLSLSLSCQIFWNDGNHFAKFRFSGDGFCGVWICPGRYAFTDNRNWHTDIGNTSDKGSFVGIGEEEPGEESGN